jgi:signal recognition particle subunit SRP68
LINLWKLGKKKGRKHLMHGPTLPLCRTIYERFASTNSSGHQEALCYSAMDDIDPNIRFCAYKLQLGGGGGSAQDIDALVTTLKQRRNGTGMDLLEAQLAKVGEEHRKEQVQALAHMTWRQEHFDVKNTRMADAIVKAQTTTAKQSSSLGVVAQYDGILSDWADAEKRIKKLLKEDKEAVAKVTSSKSAKTTQELEWIHAYIAYHLYAYSIQRNLALIDEIHASHGKVQKRIKLWDDILKVKSLY